MMRIRQWWSLAISCCILAATIGAPLTRHTCMSSHVATTQFGIQEHGCGTVQTAACERDKDTPAALSEKCCEFSIKLEKLSTESIIANNAFHSLTSAIVPATVYFTLCSTAKPYAPGIELAVAHAPPLLSGRALLTHISLLQI